MGTICVRNADWVVAWNVKAARHEYLRDADVAFAGRRIVHVGRRFGGKTVREIDGTGLMVLPGLVNIHCHPTNQPITRGVREELGNPRLYMSALYDRTGLWSADEDGLMAGAEAAYGELLAGGVTTVVDYAARVPEGWIALMARSGLRVVAAPAFRDADWHVVGESRVVYDWDEAAGRRQYERCLTLVEEARHHPCGRLSGAIAPAQVDTCTAETLQSSHRHAVASRLMWQTHAAQSLVEFHEMTRRHGTTPIRWLHGLGVLGPHATVAHAIFTDAHPWTHWPGDEDLRLLAQGGATVAHCPVVFARYGQTMRSLGGYMRRGIHIGIGTDTAPHNMLEEMREALILSRVSAVEIDDIATTRVFEAATVGGARALLRTDIGRLMPGAKADVVLADLRHPQMRPVRDPLRSLIYHAADRAVRHVFVDGRQVVEDGRVLTLDIADALDRLEAAQGRAERTVSQRAPGQRSGAEIAPLVLPFSGGRARSPATAKRPTGRRR